MAICPRCNGTGQVAGGGGMGGAGGQGDPFGAQAAAMQGNNQASTGMMRASPNLQANSMARAQGLGGDQRQTGGYHPLVVPPPTSQGPNGEPPPPGTLTGGYTPLAAPRPQPQQGVLSGLAPSQAQPQRRIM